MQRTEEIEAALNRKFFHHVEAMGFIRDGKQEPRITCFRRKTGTSTQIFAVLRQPSGGPRFRVLFTEAPLAGIYYAGKHLAPEEIYPGNFALPQGWLRPAPGKMWFGTRDSFWRRLRSEQPEDLDGLAGRVLSLFPKIVSWWETKQKDPLLLILPSRPPPAVPTHAPVFGESVNPSLLQKLFAQDRVWTVAFFGMAVSLALFFAYQVAPDWKQMLMAVLAGAAGGSILSWFVIKILWHVRVWVNGGPFRKDDVVQVIVGRYAGRIAVVYEEWGSRGQVRIDLDDQAWKSVKDVFSYVQLCRIRRASPKQEKTNPEATTKAP